MKIALFGGTFDPVHWGHLLLAESARSVFHLDRVLFIPTGIPPHKVPAAAAPLHRLRMLRLATASNPAFDVSDWEIRQKRVVYSFETIAHFHHANQRLFFILGTDMLKMIPLWRQGTSLLNRCTFLAAERPEAPWPRLPAGMRRKARRIPWPAVSLASHEIRARIRQGQSIRYQVPDTVGKYIRKHGLYR
ncbi:MAG: nicotinate (nicotinamide) nucleotide adenylyltransferase [Elusimicrobia bacterium RIFCSPLOWO2_01_FULL_59_12]|nr:MAG: nicotinate (nicotinamide) nucleotide adenylyltransferase [Elusimicrobia bacterium RIFCSPLOWO2_01_FULL_59_12]